VATVLVCVGAGIAETPRAQAAGPFWHVNSEVIPGNVPPGGTAEIVVTVTNQGDEASHGLLSIADALPGSLNATSIIGNIVKGVKKVECSIATLRCTYNEPVNPYEQIAFTVLVESGAVPGTAATLPYQVTVEGGGAPSNVSTQRVTIDEAPTPFGIQDFELLPFNEDGTAATQAGSHPFQLTTSFVLNQTAEKSARQPIALPKDVRFTLPAGLVGDPHAVAECDEADFAATNREVNFCPTDSVVGVAAVTVDEPLAKVVTRTVPVFNLVPARGEPARLGFEVIGKVPIVIDTEVSPASHYNVIATVQNASQVAGLLSSEVTLWGVPGDSRHNASRGWECVAGGAFVSQIGKACPNSNAGLGQVPFLRLPSSCATSPSHEPVTSAAEADSWAAPGAFTARLYEWMNSEGFRLGFTGCPQLAFNPQIEVVPEEHAASTPTGLHVVVRMPQHGLLEPEALSESDVRDTTVMLPAGVELSPSAANGLVGCTESQIGFEGTDAATGSEQFTSAPSLCPPASKLGTVHIHTPLLEHELEGAMYLAEPAPNGEPGKNPFGSLVALYLVARDPVSGVLVKLAGEGELDERTLRVSTTFRSAPQVPFDELTVDLFGGPRASVTTPAKCGAYQADGVLAPWSGTAPVSTLSPATDFAVTEGAGGAPCPSGALPFGPGFSAAGTVSQAGAFTGFQLELSRPDGDQALSGVTVHLPAGVAALLSSVTLCSEVQAAAAACPADSEIGHASAVAGLGPEPFVQEGGRVFITGPYHGAPFGLDIVTPAKAGPFDLGNVNVRSRLMVNPNDASVTVVSDPLPTQLKGIPLQLKRVLVTIDRPGFEFNPTSCDPGSIAGTVTGDEGAQVARASHFQVGGCENLPFAPKLTASVAGHGSRVDGTTFTVRIESAGLGQANIHKVDLELPKALPSRQETLKKACLQAVFEANPATCSPESVIGTATIHTPVLRSALRGPAYLVSHGGEAFPDVEFVLQGENITLVLDGKTDIKSGSTFSRFETAPDAPFTTFETVLPAGPHSALGVYNPASPYDLCASKLTMPTVITAQNGAVIEQSTPVVPTGCEGVASFTKAKLTRRQLLAKALKACRKKYKRPSARRARCERAAKHRYAGKTSTTHAKKGTTHAKKARRGHP
jgi:hypothetical protein